MLTKVKIAALGVIAGILTQTLIALAETWSFGPSLEPLRFVFGRITFPVITAVTLGVPVAAVYFAASRLASLSSAADAALLVAPLLVLQLIPFGSGNANVYAVFYSAVYVLTAALGAALYRRHKGWPAARSPQCSSLHKHLEGDA